MSLEPKPAPSRGLLKPTPLEAGYFAPPLGEGCGAPHGFFGRHGGVSTGIYWSLNAGTGSKDDPASVAENRRRIAEKFDKPAEQLVGVHQIHSSTAVMCDGPWQGARPEADAIVTATAGVIVSVLTADCAPVLLADRDRTAVAAAHAGWKGALGDGEHGILEATIDLMVAAGADRSRICAGIGPTIGRLSYEVGPEFRDRFPHTARERFFRRGAGDRFFFDLPGFCQMRLEKAGISEAHYVLGDTYHQFDAFFSYRRSVHNGWRDYGRNCSAIMLGR